jgi:hypothetical protein
LVYFLYACAIIYALRRLITDKRPIPFLYKLVPLIAGLLLIAFLYLFSWLVDTDGGKKVTMEGGVDNDLNFLHFQLFSDHTFKLLNHGPFGGIIYRGSYKLKADTLILNNEDLKYLYPSLTLVLKEENHKKYFEPVDSTQKMYVLFVREDGRINYQ